jgi:uncharacterized protein YjbJ (UPF0337 family)
MWESAQAFKREGPAVGWDRINKEWERFKPRVRERWARLAPSEIEAIGGDRERLVENIENAYRIGRSEAEQQVRHFEDNADANVGWDGPAGPGRRTDD